MKKLTLLILALTLLIVGCDEGIITEESAQKERGEGTKLQIKDDSLEHCLEIVDYEYNQYKDYTKECVYRKLTEHNIPKEELCGTVGAYSPAMFGISEEYCTDEREQLQEDINWECEREKPKHIKTFIEDEDPRMTDEGKAIEKCLKKYSYPY